MTFWYRIGHSLSNALAKGYLSQRVVNPEIISRCRENGGMLIASNHVSFLDPPLIGTAFDEPLHFFARKTLFDNPVSSYLYPRVNAIPVDQQKPELSTLRYVISLLRSGEKVVIFPEGERSPDGTMKEKAAPGIGMIVSKARVPVLPMRIFGAEKAMPRGSTLIRPCPVTIMAGEPVDCFDLIDDESLSTKQRYEKIADRIMGAIRELHLPAWERADKGG